MTAEEPQTQVGFAVIACDDTMETTPTATEKTLLVCPDGEGLQLEVLSVTYRCNTLTVDAGDAATVSIEWVDDSAADAVADLKADFNLLTATVLVGNEVWRGSQILDPGDALNAEFTVATPTTASEGAALVVEYRVRRRSAG